MNSTNLGICIKSIIIETITREGQRINRMAKPHRKVFESNDLACLKTSKGRYSLVSPIGGGRTTKLHSIYVVSLSPFCS